MPTIPEALALGLQYQQSGAFDRAEHVYRQVLQADPRHAGALHLLGTLAHQTGRHELAVDSLRQALALRPGDAVCHSHLGLAYRALGQLDQAEASYREALRLSPDYAEAHNNLGLVLADQQRLEEAAASYRAALRLRPDLAAAANLGIVLAAQGKRDDAAASYRQALRLDPRDAQAHANLAAVLRDQGELEAAIAAYRQALRLRPGWAQMHGKLARTLAELERWEEAEEEAVACYRQALALKPDLAEAHASLAAALTNQRRLDEALACCRRARKLQPEHVEAHWTLAVILLLRGDCERGWREHEWRWRLPSMQRPPTPGPCWDGSPAPGHTLLLRAEQGAGDIIQFVRYAPLVARRGARVLVECPESLAELVERCPGVDQVVRYGTPFPAYDAHVPLMSLPLIFQTTLAGVPAEIPYLTAGPDRVRRCRGQRDRPADLRVGIVWQCKNVYPADRERSVPLPALAGLGAVPGVRLFSLQKDPSREQLRSAPFPIIDLGSAFDTYADTAAAIVNLDLVVSVDTSVVHLAGALGVPVWLALPFASDWRWLLDREDSPWYPGMRLFRQKERGNWTDVFARIADELRRLQATLDSVI